MKDLLTHFADEFQATSHILKKYRDVPNYKAYDDNDKVIEMETIQDLKRFLQKELNAYQLVIDELDEQ